ncbi:MAG TPA: glycosyltransferase family 39 protein [Pyrinomonadaceae bacterium]|nr:glycosyltransferase family 39 protein [Pyrinomonadaceae bacterium]
MNQSLTTNTPEVSRAASFGSTWRWWLPPAIITLALVLYFVDPFIGDWDGLDYTMLSLTGYPSSMALGRNLFIFSNHLLFVTGRSLFQLQPENAYLLFKYVVVAQAPIAVVAVWVLARDLSASLFVATMASLLVVFSPVFVLYGGQVMTDVPSVLVLTLALIVHIRGVQQKKLWIILVGAALMGLGVNLRETVGFYAPWLVLAPFVFGWKFGKREVVYVVASCAVFGLLAFGWFGYWFMTDPQYRALWHGWRESMREESARHPVELANLRPYVLYFFISAPVLFLTLPFAPFREWRKHRLSPMLALWLIAFFANLVLFFNYSTTINWRYFLTGLPGLVPLGAVWLIYIGEKKLGSKRRALFAWSGVILLFAIIFFIAVRPISFEFIQRRAMSRDYRQRLESVPPDAIMISGAQTIAVHYWAIIGDRDWQTIGTGGGWPGDKLFSTVENHLTQGRRVFLDADPRWWLPCSWQRDEIPMIVELGNHFSFRRVTDTIYELRPVGDPTAPDHPNLKLLLPENRPEDTKKCPPGRR